MRGAAIHKEAMPNNLPNIPIPSNEWVDLYALSGIAVGEALAIENVGVCDVYLAVQATVPIKKHDAYSVLRRENGVRLANSEGDLGAWGFCVGESKVNVRRVSEEGFYPLVASTIYNSDGKPVDSDNPLPVSDFDNAHRNAANTIFGDRIIGTRIPTIAAQFQYGLRVDDAVVDIVTTGAVVIEDAMLKLSTGNDSTGSVGLQGADYLRYIPGHEAYAFFTAVFSPPVADLTQRIGLFDFDSGDGNGFFIGFNGLVFGITRRRAGVDTFTAVDISKAFPEGIDTFDPGKGNVYKISYGYLGFATIHFEILLPAGSFIELAQIEYPNTSTETHVANTNIPLRAEMTNSGSVVDSEMRVGSVSAGIVDGGGADPIARIFTRTLGTTTLNAGTSTQLIHFRSKATFFGITNKISSQLILLSAATDGTKPVAWGIKKNADIITPGTFVDADPDSVLEVSLDEVVDLNTGTDILFWNMARADTFFEDLEKYLVKLRPNERATIFALSQNANDIELSVRWKDLF